MDELARKARLGARIEAGWSETDVDEQLGKLHVRRRQRRMRRATGLAATALVVAGALVIVGGRTTPLAPPRPASTPAVAASRPAPPPVASPQAPVPSAPPAPLTLGDGSAVYLEDASSRLSARRVDARQVTVALESGGARFEVPAQTTRRFRVQAGAVAVETRGARFRVRVAGARVELAADHGELRVSWGEEHRLVRAGQSARFPDEAAPALPAPAAAPAPVEPPALPGSSPADAWRAVAARGDYAAAWDELARSAPPRRMEDLLLAADVARLSGHPAAAVAPLAQALASFADDPRAPLAAFTLGRVHLEDLGEPRAAAEAFARARGLAPEGPLAEDALAREVEAWSRAGEAALAATRAEAYLARYPGGRRGQAVRRFGGLGPAPR